MRKSSESGKIDAMQYARSPHGERDASTHHRRRRKAPADSIKDVGWSEDQLA
jgi:hypothetical protein